MWFILENKELYRSTGRKINSKWGTREAINVFNSWLYYKVAIGKDMVLVVCNKLSKMIHFITITKETLAEGLVKLFIDNV